MKQTVALLWILCTPLVLLGERFDHAMDRLAERLSFADQSGYWRLQVRGTLDLEGYFFARPPPGLLRTEGSSLWQPRATVYADTQAGPSIYGFAQFRVDRGFDPADQSLEARVDQFALRISPWEDGRFNLQVGQFATVVGQWNRRHGPWRNPFITAPLFYENPTQVHEHQAPGRYASADSEPPESSSGYPGNPVIWGPVYTTGAAVSGRWPKGTWAVELKNAAPLSSPDYWAWWDVGFSEPTAAWRIAYQPDLRWEVGLSAARGAFLSPTAQATLPEGITRGEFSQTLWLLDLGYAHQYWQVWVEGMWTAFRGPGMEEKSSQAYFLEIRRKLTPRFSMAARWNQQFFSLHEDRVTYQKTRSGTEMRRLDLAATFRFNAYAQMQWELGHRWVTPESGESSGRFSLATRWTLRF